MGSHATGEAVRVGNGANLTHGIIGVLVGCIGSWDVQLASH